jgi:hypothetical protein
MQELLLKIADHLIEAGGVLLLSLSSLAVHRFSAWLKMRTGIELSESDEKRVRDIISDAIHFAEESAHKAAKESSITLTGDEKLKAAINFIATATRGSLPNEEIEKRIHAEVSRLRDSKGKS